MVLFRLVMDADTLRISSEDTGVMGMGINVNVKRDREKVSIGLLFEAQLM